MVIITFFIALLLLVIVHELGHFLAARKFNIKVLEFGFGIPPRVFGKKWGETLVSFNWLPFGGFVKLLGEDDDDPKALLDKRSFVSQNALKRLIVVVSGVMMNLLLSWVLFYIVIIFNGFQIILPTLEPIVAIEEVADSSPASFAGIKQGDRILTINDQFIKDIDEFQNKIKESINKETKLAVSDWQGRNIRSVTIIPRKDPPPNQGAIGVQISPFPIRKFTSPLEKIFSGPIYSYDVLRSVLPGFGQLFKDLYSKDFEKASSQIAGPIGLVMISNSILQSGIEALIPYMYFIGIISLNLAFVNILPFPALDGGRALFILFEMVVGKRISPKIEKYIHAAGMAILLGLIILVTYSDINKFLL